MENHKPVETGKKENIISIGPLKMRRTRFFFVIVMGLTTLAIIWPGFALFSSASPFILGFPLSFAWLIMWVVIGFFALLWLFISDSRIEESD